LDRTGLIANILTSVTRIYRGVLGWIRKGWNVDGRIIYNDSLSLALASLKIFQRGRGKRFGSVSVGGVSVSIARTGVLYARR